MNLFLIRHAETASNAARVVQTPDAPLSARGIRQAERLALRLADAGIGRILASDLRRAVMTAQALGATTGAPVEFDPLLQERNFGDVRGTPYAQLRVDLFAPDWVPPGGESWEDFHRRVDEAWLRIQAAAARSPLAVVTHGLVCFSLVSRHLRWPPEAGPTPPAGRPLHFANASLTLVEGSPPWTLRRLDCTAHLDQATADDR